LARSNLTRRSSRAGGEAGLGLLEQPLRRLFAVDAALPEPLAPRYLTVGLQ
jgi:hypothetical protein